jgi:hypothetical protein
VGKPVKQLTADERAYAEERLERVQELQADYWEALNELERALGDIELSGTMDYAEATLDALIDGEDDEG